MSQLTMQASSATMSTSYRSINYAEGKAMLNDLSPNSQEYLQLQEALTKSNRIIAVQLGSIFYKINTTKKHETLRGGFGSSEHVAIGEEVILRGLPHHSPLLMRGPIIVRFQHIVALAGDFYALYDKAISLPGGTNSDKTERFREAFNTLASAEISQIRKIIAEIEEEYFIVKHSGHPHHCYSTQMVEKNNTIKKVKSDIDQLLIDNSDHFSNNAMDAYHIGHAEALRVAQDAGKQKDLEGLKLAYALDAFACHFLTDLFAAGHIRNQRGALEIFLVNEFNLLPKNAKKLAGLLTGAQHEQDGNDGLYVVNSRGDCWRAYGDGWLFHPKNQENRKKSIEAVQQSVDEIYQAFENPGVEVASQMLQLIPTVASFNPPPLYEVIENRMLFLYDGLEKEVIKTLYDYLSKAIPHALRHLPENYINGFIDGAIMPNTELPHFIVNGQVLVDKVVVPRLERLSGSIWHVIGIATYYQSTQQSQQLGNKISEVAEGLMATYDNTVQILKRLDEISSLIQSFSSEAFLRENLGKPVNDINIGVHEFQTKKSKLEGDRLVMVKNKLYDSYMALSANFTQKGDEIFKAYKNVLCLQTPSQSAQEEKIRLTFWFRQMLDYQAVALGIYLTLCRLEGESEGKIHDEIRIFQELTSRHINANSSHIDTDLIDQSFEYIALQLQKSKTRHQACLILQDS